MSIPPSGSYIAPRSARRRSRWLVIALLLIITSLPACTFGRFQFGQRLDAGAEKNLYAGQSQAEVLERLGPPDRITMKWEEAVFEYLYRENLDRELEISFFQSTFTYEQIWLRADRLIVRFDAGGHVHDYGIHFQTKGSE